MVHRLASSGCNELLAEKCVVKTVCRHCSLPLGIIHLSFSYSTHFRVPIIDRSFRNTVRVFIDQPVAPDAASTMTTPKMALPPSAAAWRCAREARPLACPLKQERKTRKGLRCNRRFVSTMSILVAIIAIGASAGRGQSPGTTPDATRMRVRVALPLHGAAHGALTLALSDPGCVGCYRVLLGWSFCGPKDFDVEWTRPNYTCTQAILPVK